MAPPLLAVPIITAVGRFAAPYLSKELSKLGLNKFVSTYGKEAFTSLNETLAADTPMLKADSVPMVNENYKAEATAFAGDLTVPGVIAPDATEIDKESKKIREMTKPVGFPADPPIKPDIKTGDTTPPEIDTAEEFPSEEEKLPNIEGFPSDTKQLPVIFEQRDVKKQTEQALEPKVEFGPLTSREKQTAMALMGDQPEFYSRVVKSIKDAKPNKLTKNKWKSFIQADKNEIKYLGLDKLLQGNESITKQELLDFVEQKNIADKLSVVQVPLADQYDFTQYSIGGAGGKRAVKTGEGYKSTVEQYVFQVDGPEQWSADPAHFAKKYAKNAIAHARAQIGYFDADAVEKRLDAKKSELSASGETRGEELSKYDETLKNASRQLEDTFIIDEIQSDMIQQIQKKGTFEDNTVIDNTNIVDYLDKNNIEYKIIPAGEPGLPKNENYKSYIEFKPTGYSTRRTIPIVKEKNTRFEIFTKEGQHGESVLNVNSKNEAIEYFKKSGTYGVPGLPITESKKYVELVLNAMIKKAVEKDLDSIGITNGQIQFDRYVGQPVEDKEGLKKFYDEIVYKQLEKIAKNYNVELETVKLPGKSEVKDFDDVGLNEPTEESDLLRISRRTNAAIRDGFVLRKVKYGTLANTIESLNRGTVEGDPLPDNATLPDYASIFTETGRGAGDNILDTLIDDNPDIENEKDYYMWVKPDSEIDKAITKANDGKLMSLARVWNNRDINLQMPISAVREIPEQAYTRGGDYTDYFGMVSEGTPNEATSVAQYNYYIKHYDKNREKIDIGYPHKIIKMKLPKKLQKDILSKPIKLSKVKAQTDRLFA
jgi:hypothetical protein